MTFIIGIDPGLSGALVVINEKSEVVDFTLMPSMSMNSKNIVNTLLLTDWIKDIQSISQGAFAVLESVHAMAGQGVSSSFNFGRSFGAIEGVLGALKVPYQYVSPQKWKKIAGVIGKDKDEPRGILMRKFPQWKELHFKGKGQALADAYFIADSYNQTRINNRGSQ